MIRHTSLLVFGGTHLGRGAAPEPDAALTGVVERIVRWRPDAIAVEVLPGHVIDTYLRLGGPFVGMRVGGVPEATACAEAVRAHHDWSLWQARTMGVDRHRSPAERTIAWCAAYEPYTALLHADGAPDLPPDVRAALDAVAAMGKEAWRIAGAAARRLGLDRLYPFDDHGDGPAPADATDAEADDDMMASLAELARPYVAATEAEVDEALARGDLWPLWRRLNTAERVAASEELESGLFLARGTPPARTRLADWRARNLLMAGRLRAVTRNYSGGRVMALVGHAHKGPMEAALRIDQGDLDISDIAELDVTL